MSNDVVSKACVSKPTLLGNTVISQRKKCFATHFKVIASGKLIEVYEYSRPILINHQGNIHDRIKIVTDDEILDIVSNSTQCQSDRSDEYKQRNINKAKNRIRRIVQANFDKVGKFLEFDFKDTDEFDIHSLTDCHKRYANFMRKLKYRFPMMKYMAVPEFQDKNKRGAVHYHAILDMPFMPWKELLKLWGHGRIYIQQIKDPAVVGIYIAKYISKALVDPRYQGHRCFYSSKNLIQPIVKYGDNLKDIIQSIEAKGFTPSYSNTYHSDWCGEITYKSYNLYNLPAQEKENNGHH